MTATIAYADVDRDECLRLARLFQLLQEVAIAHANQADTGTHAAATRGESWVLNRMAIGIEMYPRFGDTLRIETWSSGIRGFRGYREYRVRRGERVLVAASSLWLYVNLRSRTLTRVPAEIASTFPVLDDPRFDPDLDRAPLALPAESGRGATEVTVRHSDIDSNGHVNNAAYADYLQTALARQGLSPRPTGLRIKFEREILPDARAVSVIVGAQPSGGGFAMSAAGATAAVGEFRLA